MKVLYGTTEDLVKLSYKMNIRPFVYKVVSKVLSVNNIYEECEDIEVEDTDIFNPPAETVLSLFMKKDRVTKRYKEAYFNYLTDPSVRLTMLKMVVRVISGDDIILLTSPNENRYKILDLLKEFMVNFYSLEMYSIKEFIAAIDNHKVKELEIKDKDKTNIINRLNLEKKALGKSMYTKAELNKFILSEKLLKLPEKEFIRLAKKVGIKKKYLKSSNRRKVIKMMLRGNMPFM